jgi:hypothetical protein
MVMELRAQTVFGTLLLIGGATHPLAAQSGRAIPPAIEHYFDLARAEFSGDRAMELVAFMDGKSRWPGNTAFDSSLDQVEMRLRAAGYLREDTAPAGSALTYRIEKRQLRGLAWDQLSGSLTVVGAGAPLLDTRTNANMLAINSFATPDSGVVAEVVDAGKGTQPDYDRIDVRGKIVLVESPPSRAVAEAIQKRGAVGVLSYNQLPAFNRTDVNRNSIGFSSIPQDTIRRMWDIQLSPRALDSLRARLARGPVVVRAVVKTRLFPSVERTIVAEVHGSTRPDERLVFSAHVQEPGANDNATGVGVLTEVARVLGDLSRQGTVRPERTITMLFGNEIAQTRNFLADDPARAQGVKCGISLDMVGEDTEKTGGTFLIEKMPDPSAVWTRGEDKHTEWGGRPLPKSRIVPHYLNDFLLDRALDQASVSGWVVKTNPYEGGSDHSPFLDAGRPGVLFWHFTDQFYHTDGDRLDKVSTRTMTNVGVTALASALTLTTANGEVARAIIGQTEEAATDRLARELALSKQAIAGGGDSDREIDILQTWTDYYVGALGAAADIELGGSSATTKAAIEAAQARVKQTGQSAIAAIKRLASRSSGR